jgi:spore coat protein CotH
LFRDLGDDWKPYEEIYDPKTEVTEPQCRRLIELARLVTHADKAAFDATIGEWIDLDAFARFIACEALLSNYDSLFDNGQNFLLWLDPRTNRFGFSPWDLDHSWGEFGWIGTREQRERASLWHPWVGENRFLERMFAVEEFRQRYRRELGRLVDTLFLPDRLHRRIDELAAAVRPAVAEQSADRLRHFEHAVGAPSESTPSADGSRRRSSREGHQLKRFIAARRRKPGQLEGRSEAIIVRRGRQ